MVCQIEDSDVKKNTLSYVPHLTLPYLEPHSLSLSPSSSSLSLNTPLPYLNSLSYRLITVCFPTLSNPRHVVSSSLNKTKQNKTNETKPQHGVNNSLYSLTFNSSFLLGAGLAPYLLGILSSTPESHKLPQPQGPSPRTRTGRYTPLLAGLDRERERGIGKGGFCRGDFCRRVRTVRLLAFSVR